MKLYFLYHVMAVWFMAQCTVHVTWSISSPCCEKLHNIAVNNSSVFAAPPSGSQAGGEALEIRIHLLIDDFQSFLQARGIEEWISYQLENSSLLQAWNDETAVNISSIKFSMYLRATSGFTVDDYPGGLESFIHLAGTTTLNASTWEKIALAILSQSAEHNSNECSLKDETTFRFISPRHNPNAASSAFGYIRNSCPTFLKGRKPCKEVTWHWNNICLHPNFFYVQKEDSVYFNYTAAGQSTPSNITTLFYLQDNIVKRSEQFSDTLIVKETSNVTRHEKIGLMCTSNFTTFLDFEISQLCN